MTSPAQGRMAGKWQAAVMWFELRHCGSRVRALKLCHACLSSSCPPVRHRWDIVGKAPRCSVNVNAQKVCSGWECSRYLVSSWETLLVIAVFHSLAKMSTSCSFSFFKKNIVLRNVPISNIFGTISDIICFLDLRLCLWLREPYTFILEITSGWCSASSTSLRIRIYLSSENGTDYFGLNSSSWGFMALFKIHSEGYREFKPMLYVQIFLALSLGT